jgi:ankyrin repeat protein
MEEFEKQYKRRYPVPNIIDDICNRRFDYSIQYNNIDEKDLWSNTALYYAVVSNQLSVAKNLLAKGANKYLKNNNNYSPFETAKILGREEILKLFMETK